MKRLLAFITFLAIVSFPFIQPDSKSYAKTLDDVDVYKVKKEDTLFKIAYKHGVPEKELEQVNDKKVVQPGEKIIIPEGMSKQDKDLLARLIHAEAQGEPRAGKILVGLVVLNRVESEEFPDSIKKVVYDDRQFESVDNGMINEPAGEESVSAVNEAIALQGQDADSLYFFNPDQTDSTWLREQTVTTIVGNHQFAK